MSVTPRISLVAWEDRQNQFVFVAVPDERGRYLRTDKSVVMRACPFCRAIVGEPCKSRNGYSAQTHHFRRGFLPHGQRVDDWPVMPEPVPDEWMGDGA